MKIHRLEWMQRDSGNHYVVFATSKREIEKARIKLKSDENVELVFEATVFGCEISKAGIIHMLNTYCGQTNS